MDFRKTVFSFFLLVLPTVAISSDIQTLIEEEVDAYIEELKSADDESLLDVTSRITRSGLSDTRLFDLVKDILLKKHRNNLDDGDDEMVVHHVVNLLRTLASSGNFAYSSTLSHILHSSGNRAIRNRAKHLLRKVSFYNKKNNLMNNFDDHPEGQSLQSTRLLNLLKSNDLIMSRFAAEEIVRARSADDVVQEWIANRLKEQVRNDGSDLQIDTLAWYCKVLGTVNRDKYLDFLTEIAKDRSIDSKIRRHTKKILKDNGEDRWNK